MYFSATQPHERSVLSSSVTKRVRMNRWIETEQPRSSRVYIALSRKLTNLRSLIACVAAVIDSASHPQFEESGDCNNINSLSYFYNALRDTLVRNLRDEKGPDVKR